MCVMEYCAVLVFSMVRVIRATVMCCLLCVVFVFFFQAEDGIRDLVRSRGLGDVYKRQLERNVKAAADSLKDEMDSNIWITPHDRDEISCIPVSYTHLTLPTIYSV